MLKKNSQNKIGSKEKSYKSMKTIFQFTYSIFFPHQIGKCDRFISPLV